MSCFGPRWHLPHWSSWHPPENLVMGTGSANAVPHQPGVYRIRSTDPHRMAYFGESDDLAGRLVGDWSGVNELVRTSAKTSDGPIQFLAFKRSSVGSYEASWAADPGPLPYDLTDKREREALERCLGWLCRKRAGVSPLANYSRSGQGHRLLRRDDEYTGKSWSISTGALCPQSRPPHSTVWMGRRWTNLISHGELKRGLTTCLQRRYRKYPALYKILSATLDELLMVGFRQSAREGLLEVLRKLPGRPVGAWSPLPEFSLTCHCYELRADLVGAHYCCSGKVPPYRWKGTLDG